MRVALAVGGWVLALVLAYIILVRPTPPREIVIGEVRQEVVFEALPIEYIVERPVYLWELANEYRTAPGWIASSNSRIWAGLHDRVWSAPYTLPPAYKHNVNVWAGGGFGASYTRTIRDRYTIGGMMLYTDNATRVYAGAGYRW